MIHTASSRFWVLYEALPKDVRENADKNSSSSSQTQGTLRFTSNASAPSGPFALVIGTVHLATKWQVEFSGSGSDPTRITTRLSANNAVERPRGVCWPRLNAAKASCLAAQLNR